MTPSLTDSDDTVCDGAAELDQLCELFCAPLALAPARTAHDTKPFPEHCRPGGPLLTSGKHMADNRSWPPREQQNDVGSPPHEMKTLLPSEPNWHPDWALDDLGNLDRGWPSEDARLAIDGPIPASSNTRTRVKAERASGHAGAIVVAGMTDGGKASNDHAANAPDEPVQAGILVACKSPDPQIGTSFGLRALHVINKCQGVFERNASGEHDELLREIDDVRACTPAHERANNGIPNCS